MSKRICNFCSKETSQATPESYRRCWEHRFSGDLCLISGCDNNRVKGNRLNNSEPLGSPFCEECRRGRDIARIDPRHIGGTAKEIQIPTPQEFEKIKATNKQEEVQKAAEENNKQRQRTDVQRTARDVLKGIQDQMLTGNNYWSMGYKGAGPLGSDITVARLAREIVTEEMVKSGWNIHFGDEPNDSWTWTPRKVQTPTPTPVDTEEKFWHYPTFVGRVCVSDPDLINKTPESPRLPLVGSLRPDNFGEYLQEYWCFIYRDHNLEWHIWRGPSENIFRDNPMPALAGLLDIYQDKFSGVGYLHSGDGGVYTVVTSSLPFK